MSTRLNFNQISGLTSSLSDLESEILQEESRVDSILSGSKQSLDTFSEAYQSIQSLEAVINSITSTSSNLPSGIMILLSNDEVEVTGSPNNNSIKSYVVPSNNYSQIMVESEVGFLSNANLSGTCNFQILYNDVVVRQAQIEFDATGAGDQHAAGYTLKYSGNFLKKEHTRKL